MKPSVSEKLVDLLIQATREKSHHYVANVCREAIDEISNLKRELWTLEQKLEIAVEALKAISLENIYVGSSMKLSEKREKLVKSVVPMDRASFRFGWNNAIQAVRESVKFDEKKAMGMWADKENGEIWDYVDGAKWENERIMKLLGE